jgi:hypothetical protein
MFDVRYLISILTSILSTLRPVAIPRERWAQWSQSMRHG